MPADFFIDPLIGVVFSKATGVLTAADGWDHMDRLQHDPDFQPELSQLWDFREVTEVAASDEDIRRLAERTIFGPHSKRAFVVSSDVQFGLGRMFATYREIHGEQGIRIFRETAEALSWLSLSAEPNRKLFTKLGPTDDIAEP